MEDARVAHALVRFCLKFRRAVRFGTFVSASVAKFSVLVLGWVARVETFVAQEVVLPRRVREVQQRVVLGLRVHDAVGETFVVIGIGHATRHVAMVLERRPYTLLVPGLQTRGQQQMNQFPYSIPATTLVLVPTWLMRTIPFGWPRASLGLFQQIALHKIRGSCMGVTFHARR